MNITKNITINLSKKDVKELIAEYCRQNGYEVKAEDVNLLVRRRYVGFGSMEHEECCFDGAKVSLKRE